MQTLNLHALVVRALKTFAQAFLATVIAGLTTTMNVSTLRALVIAAFAAGVSAVMNLFVKPQTR